MNTTSGKFDITMNSLFVLLNKLPCLSLCLLVCLFPKFLTISNGVNLQECCAVEDPRPHHPPASQSQTGLRGQYINTTPSKHFVNGNGLSYAFHNGVRSPACGSSHKKGPIYCPPVKHARDRGEKTKSNDSDVDMTPAHISSMQKDNKEVMPHPQSTDSKRKNTAMECCSTAIDPEEDDTSQAEFTPPFYSKDPVEAEPRTTEKPPDQCTSPAHADAANVGDPRLAHPHSDNPVVPVQSSSGLCNSSGSIDDDRNSHLTQATTGAPNAASRDGHDKKHAVKNNNTPTTKTASSTIRDFLVKNAAFQPQPDDAIDPATDDEVIVVHETTIADPLSIDNILCQHEQSRDLLQSCREIIAGWPSSFAHANIDFFLETCNMLHDTVS